MNTQFEAHDTATHGKALHAFRRRRRMTHLRLSAQLLAVLTLVIYWFGSQRPSNNLLVLDTPRSIPEPPLSERSEPRALSDDELVAKFPPGSCFMAEVNGKKILVFKDPAVEKQFFQ